MKRTTLFLATLLASMSMSGVALANEDKSFRDIDQDGDENLSQQELQQAGKDDVNVQELDQDSDGVLSKDEFKQAKDQMKDQQSQ